MEAHSNQKLGYYSLSMIVIGLVIGLGIFRAASTAANAAISPTIFFGAWIFGGFIAICGALTYAEIGSRYPVTGAYYKIFSEAYHPSVAFAINGIVLVSNAASLGGVALIGSDYLSEVVFDQPPTDAIKALIGIGAIALFYGINLMGLRISSKALNILMFIKIGMILLIISALFFPSTHVIQQVDIVQADTISWKSILASFAACLVAVSFTYGGYQQTINFGEEIHSPNKTISKSIFTGILIVIALYLLVNLSYYKVIGFEELKSAKGIAALVAGKLFGPFGKSLFAILLFLAVLAYVDVMLLSNPRVMYAMSKDGMLPAAFSKKYGKREVLTFGLTAFSLISMIVIFYAETFDRILGFVMILDSLGMATSAATLFYFRRKSNADSSSEIYKIKFYPWMPLLFIITYVFVGLACISANPSYGLTSLIVFVTLVLLYFIIRKMGRGEARV